MEETKYYIDLLIYEEGESKILDNLESSAKFKASCLEELFDIIRFLEENLNESNYSIEFYKS